MTFIWEYGNIGYSLIINRSNMQNYHVEAFKTLVKLIEEGYDCDEVEQCALDDEETHIDRLALMQDMDINSYAD